jgi:hypothetical protein
MTYIDPNTVFSPKDRWGQVFKVIYNTGQGGWSAAEGSWDDNPCLAMRWNGADGDQFIGNPQSRGHATWFVIPDDLAGAIRKQIELLEKSGGTVVCEITRPADYSEGAWRIEAQLSQHVLENLGNSDLTFSLPDLPKRMCIPEKKYVRAAANGLAGVFVEGKWFGDLYSNGIAEADNPVTVDAFRDAFIQNVNQTVQRAGLMR